MALLKFTHKINTFSILLLTSLSLFSYHQTFGQASKNNLEEVKQTLYSEDIIPLVKDYLDQPNDTTINTVFKIVRNICGSEFSCLYDDYAAILKEIELGNKYWLGVRFAEEMIKIAEAEGDLKRMAKATKSLADLHSFLGLSNNSLYVRDIQIVGGTTYMGILGGVVISPTAPTPVDITVNTATSASYTFTPQTGDESCTYQVVITDANNCEVTSNAVSFSDAAPENCCDLAISTPPTNQTVCAGEDVTFSVAGTSSAGGSTYQWQQLCESEPAWDLIASSTTTGFPGDRILDVKVDGANIYVGSISTGFGIFDGTSWTTVTSATTGFPASNRVRLYKLS